MEVCEKSKNRCTDAPQPIQSSLRKVGKKNVQKCQSLDSRCLKPIEGGSTYHGYLHSQVFTERGWLQRRFSTILHILKIPIKCTEFWRDVAKYRLFVSCNSAPSDAMWISSRAFSCVTFLRKSLAFSNSTDCCFTRSSSSCIIFSWPTNMQKNRVKSNITSANKGGSMR